MDRSVLSVEYTVWAEKFRGLEAALAEPVAGIWRIAQFAFARAIPVEVPVAPT
jgi:hypothetical protein